MKIGFIGAGKVGFSLGKYFLEHEQNISGYYSKNINSAIEAAKFINVEAFNSLEEVVKKSDIVMITTPDGVIEEVWNDIKNGYGFRQDEINIINKWFTLETN